MGDRQLHVRPLPRGSQRGTRLVLAGEGANLDGPLPGRGRGAAAERNGLGRIGRRDDLEAVVLRRRRRGGDQGHLLRLHRPGPRRFRQLRHLDRRADRHPSATAIAAGELRGAAIPRSWRNVDRQRVHRILLGRRAHLRIHAHDVRPDHRHVAAGLIRQRTIVRQVVIEPAGPAIVGGEEARRAVDVVHLPQIRGAGEDVVARIERVVAQVVPRTQLVIGRGHHLHQAHRAGIGRDQFAVVVEPATGFHPHHGADPELGHVESRRRFVDVGAPRILGRSRRHVVPLGVRHVARRFLLGIRCRPLARAGRQQCHRGDAGRCREQAGGTARSGHPLGASVMSWPQWPGSATTGRSSVQMGGQEVCVTPYPGSQFAASRSGCR